jgi:hypothetical protein
MAEVGNMIFQNFRFLCFLSALYTSNERIIGKACLSVRVFDLRIF